jgi:hypothetical protein
LPNGCAGLFVLERGIGRKKVEVKGDKERMKTVEKLGNNMAWFIKKTERLTVHAASFSFT